MGVLKAGRRTDPGLGHGPGPRRDDRDDLPDRLRRPRADAAGHLDRPEVPRERRRQRRRRAALELRPRTGTRTRWDRRGTTAGKRGRTVDGRAAPGQARRVEEEERQEEASWQRAAGRRPTADDGNDATRRRTRTDRCRTTHGIPTAERKRRP